MANPSGRESPVSSENSVENNSADPTLAAMSMATEQENLEQIAAAKMENSESETLDSTVREQTQSLAKEEAGVSGNVHSGIDVLLQRHRNEIMYELRRLQHGDRPVTGQENHRAVEDLLNRTQGNVTTPPEEHRPEAVIVEVQGLVESRPVSSLLGAAFRRRLENTLRGSLSTADRARPRIEIRNRRQDRGQQATSSTRARTNQNGAPTPPPLPSQIPENQPELMRVPPTNVHVYNAPPPPPPQAAVTPEPSRSERAQSWLQQHVENITNGDGQQNAVWDTLEEAQREQLIFDISELVQRQLVTDTLNGTFRDVLERSMAERLAHSGTDGNRVASYIQQLPRSGIVRNDFSHLGVATAAAQGIDAVSDEAVSVISATAAVHIPYSQSNVALNREIQGLKSQLAEMKSMMKLSFDLQLDLQRAIRQEVSAALSQVNQDQQATASAPFSRPVQDTQCLICIDQHADSVLYQCGHMCVCYSCGMNLRSRGAHCPICRAPIRDIIRTYRCSME